MKCCPKLPDEQKQIFTIRDLFMKALFVQMTFDFRLSRISDDKKIRQGLSCSPFSLTVYS